MQKRRNREQRFRKSLWWQMGKNQSLPLQTQQKDQLKKWSGLGMVADGFNPGTWGAVAGGSPGPRSACSIEPAPGEPGLHRETLSPKSNQPTNPGCPNLHQSSLLCYNAHGLAICNRTAPSLTRHFVLWAQGLSLTAPFVLGVSSLPYSTHLRSCAFLCLFSTLPGRT